MYFQDGYFVHFGEKIIDFVLCNISAVTKKAIFKIAVIFV